MIELTAITMSVLMLFILGAFNKPYPHLNKQRLENKRRDNWENKQDEKYIKNLIKKQGLRIPKTSNIVPKKTYYPSQNSFKYNGFGINGAFSINSSKRYNPLSAIQLTYKQKRLNERIGKFHARLDKMSEEGHIKAECVEDLMREFSEGNGFTDLFGESDFSYIHDFNANVDFPDTRFSGSYALAASNASDWEKSRADKICSGTDDDVDYLGLLTKLATTGGHIELSTGDFYFNTQLTCISDVWTSGQGDKTVIHAVENGVSEFSELFRIVGSSNLTNIRFSDMKFTGNGLTNYRNFIAVFGSGDTSYLYFDNLTMDYARKGIAIHNANHVFVSNCRFTNGKHYMIYSFGGVDIVINNCSFDNCDIGTVITCNFTKRLTINNVIGLNCQEHLIDISGINGQVSPFSQYITINNAVAVTCGGLLLSQNTANPDVWAEHVTVNNGSVYGNVLYGAITGIFNGLTVNNLIIENTNFRRYLALQGNHIHLNNIQCLTYGRDEGIIIFPSAEFPTLIDIKLSNIYVENVEPHPGDPGTFGFGNGIHIKSTNNGSGLQLINCEVVACHADGFRIDNFDDPIIQGCIANGNSLSGTGSFDGFRLINFNDGIITNNRSKGSDQNYAMNLTRTGSEGKNTIKNNRLTAGDTGALNYPANAGNIVYDKFVETNYTVTAVSATRISANEDLSVGVPITFTINAQPDAPRTLSGHFDSHAQITAYTIDILGINGKGETLTETKTEVDGWDWETNNAFKKVTSITMSARTGTGAGDTMDIGVTDVIGLCNTFYETSDIYGIKLDNADQTVAGAQINTTYHTYDLSVIGLFGGSTYTFWYKKNLNIID